VGGWLPREVTSCDWPPPEGTGRRCDAAGLCAAGGGHLAGRAAAGVGMAGSCCPCWRGRRARVTSTFDVSPPVSARPAAHARGRHRAGRVAAGVGMATGGYANWREWRAKEPTSCDWPAAGVGETGAGRVGRGGALVCCRRRFYGRQRPFGGSGCRRHRYGRRRLCVLVGAASKRGNQM